LLSFGDKQTVSQEVKKQLKDMSKKDIPEMMKKQMTEMMRKDLPALLQEMSRYGYLNRGNVNLKEKISMPFMQSYGGVHLGGLKDTFSNDNMYQTMKNKITFGLNMQAQNIKINNNSPVHTQRRGFGN
jgi:hypothetical protein